MALRHTLSVVVSLSLLAPPVEALQGGETCEADGGCDEVSALQVRERASAAASTGRWAPPAVSVMSQLNLGSGPTFEQCTIAEFSSQPSSDSLLQLGLWRGASAKQSPPPQYVDSTYGAGGGGAGWNWGMAVFYLDPATTSNDSEVYLNLDLVSQAPAWTLETGDMVVAGLKEMLPQELVWKATGPPGETTLACAPMYCRMPAPLGGGSGAPGFCSFAPERANVTMAAPAPGDTATLAFDITQLVKDGYTAFQVSTSAERDSQGFWQTAQYVITSYSFGPSAQSS